MRLTRVTITGADNTTNPRDLVSLTKEFRFVEWGILFGSGTLRNPRPRFPGIAQVDEIVTKLKYAGANLSAHLCGSFVRDLVIQGDATDLALFGDFQRIQLNYHGKFHEAHKDLVGIINAHRNQRFILQCDGVNDEAVRAICKETLSGPLFDRSGGAGILPASWPKAWPDTFCGYAGGLSPYNVAEEICKMVEVASDEQVWIDTETRVRTDDDKELDMELVYEFLKAAEPFVWKQPKP